MQAWMTSSVVKFLCSEDCWHLIYCCTAYKSGTTLTMAPQLGAERCAHTHVLARPGIGWPDSRPITLSCHASCRILRSGGVDSQATAMLFNQ